jgi:hypothetical protein
MRAFRTLPAALALLAAGPAAAESTWVTWDSPAQAYIGTNPHAPDFVLYQEADGTFRPVVWEAENASVADLAAQGCAFVADPEQGSARGKACPAALTIDAFEQDGDLVVVVRRLDGLGRPGQALAPE